MAKKSFSVSQKEFRQQIARVIAKHTVLIPLLQSKVSDAEFVRSSEVVRRQWRSYCRLLSHYGIEATTNAICSMSSCPPCGYYPKESRQRVGIPCRRLLCPFCYARRVLDVYWRLYAASKKGNCLVTYGKEIGGNIDKEDYSPIVEDFERMTEDYTNIWIGSRDMAVSIYSKDLFRPVGGIWSCVLIPMQNEFEYYWLRRHRGIAIMSEQSTFPDWVNRHDWPRAMKLAWIVGSTFAYPVEWLKAPASIMSMYFSIAKSTRHINPFGALHGNSNRSASPRKRKARNDT